MRYAFMKEIITNNTTETKKIAGRFANILQSGDIVGLTGELAAGKTTFIKWVASKWRITHQDITSSSFVIIKKHFTKNKLPFYHADLYRLNASQLPDELYEIMDSKKGFLFLEWADRMTIPQDHFLINIEMISLKQRKITLKASCKNLENRLEKMNKS